VVFLALNGSGEDFKYCVRFYISLLAFVTFSLVHILLTSGLSLFKNHLCSIWDSCHLAIFMLGLQTKGCLLCKHISSIPLTTVGSGLIWVVLVLNSLKTRHISYFKYAELWCFFFFIFLFPCVLLFFCGFSVCLATSNSYEYAFMVRILYFSGLWCGESIMVSFENCSMNYHFILKGQIICSAIVPLYSAE